MRRQAIIATAAERARADAIARGAYVDEADMIATQAAEAKARELAVETASAHTVSAPSGVSQPEPLFRPRPAAAPTIGFARPIDAPATSGIIVPDEPLYARFRALPEEDRARRIEEERRRSNYEDERLRASDPQQILRNAASRFNRETDLQDTIRRRMEVLERKPRFDVSTGAVSAGLPAGADVIFGGTPGWYGGPEGIVKRLIEQAASNYNLPYEVYPEERIARLSQSEQSAARVLQDMAADPRLEDVTARGIKSLEDVGNFRTASMIDPLIAASMGFNPAELEKYISHASPFQRQVVDSFVKDARERTSEDLRKLNRQFAIRGGFHSGARQKAVADLERKTQDDINRYVAGLKMKGYESAVGQLAHEQAGYGKGAEALRSATEADLGRKVGAVEGAQKLERLQQAERRSNVDAMSQLGARMRQIEQMGLSQAYEDWQRQREYPFRQVHELSQIVRGLEPRDRVAFGARPVNPAEIPTNPFTAAGGMLGTLAATQLDSGRKRKEEAEGGRIIMADGGVADIPERIEMINKMRDRINELEVPASGFGKYIRNLTTGIAASKPGTDFWTAAAQSLPYANAGIDEAEKINEARANQRLSLQEAIAESQAKQKERELEFDMAKKKFSLAQKMNTARIQKLLEKPIAGKGSHIGMEEETMPIIEPHIKKALEKGEAKAVENIIESKKSTEDKLAKYKRIGKEIPQVGFTEFFGHEVPEVVSSISDWFTGGKRKSREEFRAINAELLSDITKEQKGNQSDADMALWQLTTPNLKNSQTGLKTIFKRREAIEERNIQANEFFTDALQNGIPFNEAQKIWKSKVNTKPLFNEDGDIIKENLKLY